MAQTPAPDGAPEKPPVRRRATKRAAPAPEPAYVDRGDAWAVVGAGPHGLSALKALLQNGIAADGYERESDVGGNWNFGAENSRVYESTHTISSKPFTQFPDFPMPDSYPDYPSHRQVKEYFGRYADHFGLRKRISFGHDVVRALPVEDGRAWDVTVRDRVSAQETTYRYAGLVVGNGHNWSPKIPQYPGQDTFSGEILHSADYKGADVLRGRRVLVVGAGNTGCDVAVEGAQNAVHTWHSTRRGYYYNPKYMTGRPSDQVADSLLALRLPLGLRRTQRAVDRIQIVSILHRLRVPAIRFETPGTSFREGDVGRSGKCDVVVVIETNQFAELQMTSERRSLGRHSFH